MEPFIHYITFFTSIIETIQAIEGRKYFPRGPQTASSPMLGSPAL